MGSFPERYKGGSVPFFACSKISPDFTEGKLLIQQKDFLKKRLNEAK